jgi:hypothetical protein
VCVCVCVCVYVCMCVCVGVRGGERERGREDGRETQTRCLSKHWVNFMGGGRWAASEQKRLAGLCLKEGPTESFRGGRGWHSAWALQGSEVPSVDMLGGFNCLSDLPPHKVVFTIRRFPHEVVVRPRQLKQPLRFASTQGGPDKRGFPQNVVVRPR